MEQGFSKGFPDPVLTANVYCSGHIDALIFRGIAPFWRAFRKELPSSASYLWLLRYGRGGEHLKVRVHGRDELHSQLRPRLADSVSSFFASLPPPPMPVVKRGWGRTPPIDDEDAVEEDHPDRTFLWTHSRRSSVVLGGEPYLSDDVYAARLTRCLGESSEIVLSLGPNDDGTLSHKVRQTTLLKALIAGLAIPNISRDERLAYLTYHRDWLLRFALPRNLRSEREPLEQLVHNFETRIDQMSEDSRRPLKKAVMTNWSDGRGGVTRMEGGLSGWLRAFMELLEHIAPFRANPAYRIDPFANDALFGPMFKVFHCFANQLGINIAEEAFVHHLLVHMASSSLATFVQETVAS